MPLANEGKNMSAATLSMSVGEQAVPRRSPTLLRPGFSMPARVHECNVSVSNLSHTDSTASKASRASVASRLSQWMKTSTAQFHRQLSKESKTSSSTGSSSFVNVDDMEGVSVGWPNEPKSRKRYPKKVPIAAFEALAQHHEMHRRAAKEVEEQLLLHRQQLEYERKQAMEKRIALEKYDAEIRSLRKALGDALGQLDEMRNEAHASKQAAREAQKRADDDRSAAEVVYEMFVNLSLEHQSTLSELERYIEFASRTGNWLGEMPTVKEEELQERPGEMQSYFGFKDGTSPSLMRTLSPPS